MQTYDEGKSTCYFIAQEIGQPSLITINSLEEQQFVENLLFNQNKVVDNIWLGARRDYKTGQFEWDMKNRIRLTYTNWLTYTVNIYKLKWQIEK